MHIGIQDISKSVLVNGEVATSIERNVPLLPLQQQRNSRELSETFYTSRQRNRASRAFLLLLHNTNDTADITSVPVWLGGGFSLGLFNKFLPKKFSKFSVLSWLLIKVCSCMWYFIVCKRDTSLSCICVYPFYVYICMWNPHISMCIFCVYMYISGSGWLKKMPHCSWKVAVKHLRIIYLIHLNY